MEFDIDPSVWCFELMVLFDNDTLMADIEGDLKIFMAKRSENNGRNQWRKSPAS
jgi:hypothetical protein